MFKRSFLRGKQFPLVRPYTTTTRRSFNPALLFAGGTIIGGYTVYKLSNLPVALADTPSLASTLPLEQLTSPTYATNAEIDQAIQEIRAAFLANTPDVDESLLINSTEEELQGHSDTYFNSHHATKTQRPKYVVYPRSTQEVSQIMKICHKYSIPVVATSGKSSLEGHFIPTRGGISIDISSMSNVVQLNKTDLDVVVQGGIGWEELDDYLAPYNLLFSTDPGPGATIAGALACNASGTNAYRYGETFKNVLNLTVVLADGTIVKTKQRPRKSSAGYNLTSLFVGSEGTLGIITEATLRLNVRPTEESVIVVPFHSIADAANAVNDIVLTGVQMSAIELLDDKMMNVVNLSGETTRKWIEKPTLFLKIGGPNLDVLRATVDQLKKIAAEHNNVDFQFASDADERTELWSARKVALWSSINHGIEIDKDMQLWTTDAAVPISKLPQFLMETKADIDAHGLKNTLVAHIGDGNAHSFILYTPDERKIAETVVSNMVQRAVNYEGTCTGEHGIGFGKREFLLQEVGQIPVDVMRNIKLALDPKRILNPDKIFKIDPNEPEGH
ncbi:mitochondrial enzyme D-lactate ferricytochrome c oxidoreductase [Spathaspora passalidarum NRRL Y-27907]|uniref:D-lactate dehydrogenase (cytochrome) n=1 Tax=Spathaspora passalidarum (strain NRRL Y-27907 / 11-Y1) TaxID=619300 RepID=G3AIK1_SPAPN|nr:mitochondrial enzyme D-lactate ferricytochrome c oxidoreductase [Spathaspora passalidarum NRRL Y-27907]EGW33716.1 mitochondrial enzyme D-lactate ferricytochrome c oxidoreductase [Spathaspora passalidarum NRRL Y-27907]